MEIRSDGMRRARRFSVTPRANSAGELEQQALGQAREFFGDGVQLELDANYTVSPRTSLMGVLPDPRYFGHLTVYELVPDERAAEAELRGQILTTRARP